MTDSPLGASLAKSLHDLEGTVEHQDGMIKDLVRLIRMQNSEINAILHHQSQQTKEHEREQHRLGLIVEKLDGRLSSFLGEQLAASATTVNPSTGEDNNSGVDSMSSLIAKVDTLDSTLRDHMQSKDSALHSRIDALESKIESLQGQISSNSDSHRTSSNAKGLKIDDLQTLIESLAKRQLSMQFQIDSLTDTLNKQINTINEQESTIADSKGSGEIQVKRETNDAESNSIHSHSRIPVEDDGHNVLSSKDEQHSHTYISDSHSTEEERNFNNQISSLRSKPFQHATTLTSQYRDILNLKRRLSTAERVIGAHYPVGSFKIQGRSVYKDATALRYIATDQAARDTFKMFYGNRLHAIHYVDIATPDVLTAFDIIARVRCRHEMWTDEKLEVKAQIRSAAEKIADDWMNSLSLRDELNDQCQSILHDLDHRSKREFRQLKVLCRCHDVEFDFELPSV